MMRRRLLPPFLLPRPPHDRPDGPSGAQRGAQHQRGQRAAATSRKSEMKLTNVARASLNDELLPDYESFLRQRGLRVWPKESRLARMMRDRLREDRVKNLPPSRPGVCS